MGNHDVIFGDEFIAMYKMAHGIPDDVRIKSLVVIAEVGEPVQVDINVFGDERLNDLARFIPPQQKKDEGSDG